MPDVFWIIATFCAFFVKGLCGFANTLVFTTILSFGNNNINISPVELILTYPANAVLTLKERKSLKWRVCLPLTALVLAGSIPGILLLKNADVTLIKIIFGAVTVIVAVEMLIRNLRKREHEPVSKLFLGVIGLLLGMLCSKLINEKIVRKLVIIMLIISGISLIVSSI